MLTEIEQITVSTLANLSKAQLQIYQIKWSLYTLLKNSLHSKLAHICVYIYIYIAQVSKIILTQSKLFLIFNFIIKTIFNLTIININKQEKSY